MSTITKEYIDNVIENLIEKGYEVVDTTTEKHYVKLTVKRFGITMQMKIDPNCWI